MDNFIQQLLSAITPAQSSNGSGSAVAASAATDNQDFGSAFMSAFAEASQSGATTNNTSNGSQVSNETTTNVLANDQKSSQSSAAFDANGYAKSADGEINRLNKLGEHPSKYGSAADNDGTQHFGLFTTGDGRNEHYQNTKKDAEITEGVQKAQLIKDAKAAGIPQNEVQSRIQQVDKVTRTTKPQTGASMIDIQVSQETGRNVTLPSNPYQLEYQQAGGDKNHDKRQKVLKDQAKLFDLENQNHQNLSIAGDAAGKSESQIQSDIKKSQDQNNNKLGVNLSSKEQQTAKNQDRPTAKTTTNQSQNDTKRTTSTSPIQAFEQQYGLANNSANNYLSQVVLNAQQNQAQSGANQNPNLVAVTTTYNQLHQQDTQNGIAGTKDNQISQALSKSTVNLFQNQNQQNTSATLNKYNSDNKQMSNVLQKQNQQQSNAAKDASLEK